MVQAFGALRSSASAPPAVRCLSSGRQPEILRGVVTRLLLLSVLVLVGCSSGDGGDDGDGGRDAGNNVPTAPCGIEGTPASSMCMDASDCGQTDVRFNCTNCPIEATQATCVSGQCDTYDDSGRVRFGFNVVNAGAGGNSYVGMIIDPMMANGDRVTCAALLSTCPIVNNKELNVVNVDVGNPAGGLQQGQAYILTPFAHVGENRIGYLFVTSQMAGSGDVIAHGCTEGVAITSGQQTDVLIELVEK